MYIYMYIHILVRVQVVPRYIVYVYPWSLYHEIYIISILVFRYICIYISDYLGICNICISLVIVSYVI